MATMDEVRYEAASVVDAHEEVERLREEMSKASEALDAAKERFIDTAHAAMTFQPGKEYTFEKGAYLLRVGESWADAPASSLLVEENDINHL